MLIQDKAQETQATTTEVTSAQGSPIPAGTLAADSQRATRSSRSRRRSVWLPAATAALVGLVTLVAVTQSDHDAANHGRVSDRSFDMAETNRMETLRNLTSGA